LLDDRKVDKLIPVEELIMSSAAVFSPHEVAELSGAPKRLVEKAIEERVLSPRSALSPGMRRARRMLPAYSVAYAAALKGLDLNLSLRHKKRLARIIADTPADALATTRAHIAPAVEIDLGHLVADAVAKTEKYRVARDTFIAIDEDIKGGTPVIRGTRMTVYAILGRVEHGDTVEDILEENPDLTRDAIEAAIIYARTHPLVGRPGGRPWTSQA
jgi:uncharacterized protein (DUF433 family)